LPLRLRAVARSNDPACEAAAGDELSKGGSAIDAVFEATTVENAQAIVGKTALTVCENRN